MFRPYHREGLKAQGVGCKARTIYLVPMFLRYALCALLYANLLGGLALCQVLLTFCGDLVFGRPANFNRYVYVCLFFEHIQVRL